MQCSNASPLCIVAKPILVGDFVGDPGAWSDHWTGAGRQAST